MNKNRPVNLDISTIRFPITAYTSILHRLSGAFLLGGVLVLMWMLDASLTSEESFNELKRTLDQLWLKILLWAVLGGLAFHLTTGVRHLFMELGIGESLAGGRMGAKLALTVAAVLILIIAGWILW